MYTLCVYGFLGSGKTTLINHLLGGVFAGRRVVVLENESGKESIDGDFLRGRNYEVVDLRAGCVCCTLRGELVAAVSHIETERNPDVLCIEPSGIAALDDLLQLPGVRIDGVVTLVDVERYDLLMRLNPDFYRRQFRLSPILLLTKTGCVEPSVTERIARRLGALNPAARILGDYRDVTEEQWRGLLFGHCVRFRTFALDRPVARHHFACRTYELGTPVSEEAVQSFFHGMERCGVQPVRAKGALVVGGRPMKVDYVAGRTDFTPIKAGRIGSFSFWWAQPLSSEREARVERMIKELNYGKC